MKIVLSTRKHPNYLNEIHTYSKTINHTNEKGMTALILACSNSNTCSTFETVKELIKNGADLNIQDNQGLTALMYSIKYLKSNSNIETVKELIKNGTDLNIRDCYGNTVLMRVVKKNVVRMILK